jgi:hypothetical protein
MTERPPMLYWMLVKNADAEDYGRIGMLMDIVGKDDDPDVARHFILDFQDGRGGVAFMPEEVERVYVV